MPVSEHYNGHGAKVMRSMKKTYGDTDTTKRIFYATENKRKNEKKRSSKRQAK